MPMKTDGPAQGNMYRDQCTEHKPTYVQSKQRYMYRAIRTEHSDVCTEHTMTYVQSAKRYMYRAYNDICTEHTPTYLQSIRRDMYRAENETTTNTQTTMQKPTRQHCKTQPSKPDSNAKHASEEKHRERANRRLLCGNARGSTSKESLSKQIPMRKALRERAPRAQSRPEPISEKSGPDSKLEVFNTLLIVKVTKKWPGQVPALLAAPGASPGRR